MAQRGRPRKIPLVEPPERVGLSLTESHQQLGSYTNPLLEEFAETQNWFNNPTFYKRLAEDERFNSFVEVGVWKGHSIRFLAHELSKRENKNFTIFAVDLWEKLPKDNELWKKHPEQMPYLYEIYNHNLEEAGVRDLISDIRKDSADAATLFENGSVDFVFIDASHDKDSVIRDIKAWLPKVRKGGVLAGDDFHNGGVREAVTETLSGFDVRFSEEHDTWAVYLK